MHAGYMPIIYLFYLRNSNVWLSRTLLKRDMPTRSCCTYSDTHQSAVRVLEITATCCDDLFCRIDFGRILKESCL
jgi:hypothetical protein